MIGYSAGVGYDLVTGLGTVDANVLVTSWPTFVATPSFSVGEPQSRLRARDSLALRQLMCPRPTGLLARCPDLQRPARRRDLRVQSGFVDDGHIHANNHDDRGDTDCDFQHHGHRNFWSCDALNHG